MTSPRKQSLLIGGSLVLFGGLVALDFLHPRGHWYSIHPMTVTAIGSAVAFVIASLLVGAWLKNREIDRLTPVSTVAYRSLAQYVNDAGRSLLAPVAGIDIVALGIPTASKEEVQIYQSRLERIGFPLIAPDPTGSWKTDRSELGPRLDALLEEPEFVNEIFRITAHNRRRLQEATATWAPVMLLTRNYADDLGKLRELSDALELLQERLRTSGTVGVLESQWSPTSKWKQSTELEFWSCIDIYEKLRDDFADLAALPSDSIVNRKATSTPPTSNPTGNTEDG